MGLEAVLNHPAVWRGNECARVASAVPTGFAELDAHLPAPHRVTAYPPGFGHNPATAGEAKIIPQMLFRGI